MSYNQGLIAELKMEAVNTRKMLERVPMDNGNWRPHEKSMMLSKLSTHIADLPYFITLIMTAPELDFLSGAFKPVTATSGEELAAHFDNRINEAVAALENAADSDFDQIWTMRRGEHVIFSLPKKVALRSIAYSHMYHHRGQLSVYLRLLDIPVPGMYGPSADDTIAMAAKAAAGAN